MSGVEVVVRSGGTDLPAGTLYTHRRGRTESSTFAYDTGYLADPAAYGLSPELPLRAGPVQTPTTRSLFGAFGDCAPDRWGRTLILRRETALARAEQRAARSLAEVDLLLGVRDDLRQGALRFRTSPGGGFLADADVGVPALVDLPALLDLAARAEADAADLPDLQRLVRAGSSLGGARPKAHVLNRDGRVAIAKFPSADRDTWDVMAWEKVALDLARAAGIVVPASELLHLAGRHVLVLDRFDRTPGGERIGYVSAMTMLEAVDHDRRSYLEIAEVVETTSPQPTRDLEQLWRRVVLTVLVRNTDDHLRNHGFLHGRAGQWRLSPAFDVNPTPVRGDAYLSTSISAGDETASLALALEVADWFRLGPEQARAVLAEVAAAVSRWRDVAAGHGLDHAAQERMAPAFVALGEAADV